MRSRAEPRAKAHLYWHKAERLAAAARTVAGAEAQVIMASAAAINAIDAACVANLEQRSASSHHGDALTLVKRIDGDAGAIQRVRKHFQVLLQVRHAAAYTAEPIADTDGKKAVQHLERLLVACRELLPDDA